MALMAYLVYLFYRTLVLLFEFIPFSLLYKLADILYFFFRYVIRYRYSVIVDNLTRCFPEKSKQEINSIIHQVYINLADITVESLKGLSLSQFEIQDRYCFKNIELVNSYLDQSQSVILAPIHYTNWEWSVIAYGYYFPQKAIGIYKPIRNPYIEADINKRRSRGSLQLIPTNETRKIRDELPNGRAVIFMSDQNPSNTKDAFWVNFFNRDTACLHGMEKYASNYNLPVFFCDMYRTNRGYYTLEFKLISAESSALQAGVVTQSYMTMLENRIRKNPGDWLWSHKRWKHKRS